MLFSLNLSSKPEEFERLEKALVMVYGEPFLNKESQSPGTGFLIKDERGNVQIMTASHIPAELRTIFIKSFDSDEIFQAEVKKLPSGKACAHGDAVILELLDPTKKLPYEKFALELSPNPEKHIKNGNKIIVSGINYWGKKPIIQSQSANIVKEKLSNKIINNKPPETLVTENGFQASANICGGFSGSPAMIYDIDLKQYFLIGLVSEGFSVKVNDFGKIKVSKIDPIFEGVQSLKIALEKAVNCSAKTKNIGNKSPSFPEIKTFNLGKFSVQPEFIAYLEQDRREELQTYLLSIDPNNLLGQEKEDWLLKEEAEKQLFQEEYIKRIKQIDCILKDEIQVGENSKVGKIYSFFEPFIPSLRTIAIFLGGCDTEIATTLLILICRFKDRQTQT